MQCMERIGDLKMQFSKISGVSRNLTKAADKNCQGEEQGLSLEYLET